MANEWHWDLKALGADGWGWLVWPKGRISDGKGGLCETHEEAMKAICEITEPPKPADPAWMVEVAREANARRCEREGYPNAAVEYRSGRADSEPGVVTLKEALYLALERGHVVDPEMLEPARRWTEEELLKAAMDDAEQAYRENGMPNSAARVRSGDCEDHVVRAALQARRNMLREMGATAVYVDRRELPADVVRGWNSSRNDMGRLDPAKLKPLFYREGSTQAFDLEAALKRAWDAGWSKCHSTHASHSSMTKTWKPDNAGGFRHRDVSSILSTLPAKE